MPIQGIDIIASLWYLDIKMRTTVNIDDDVLTFAKSAAEAREVSIGRVLSDLARRGMDNPVHTEIDPVTGFLVFCGGKPFGPKEVQEALDAEDLEYAKYFRTP